MSFDRICGSVALLLLTLALAVGGIACIREGHWALGGLGFLLIGGSLRAGDAFWKRIFPWLAT